MTTARLSLDPEPGEEWMDAAACAAVTDDALLRRMADSSRSRRGDRELIAICHRCPVLQECGDYADEHGERFGIWGGRRRS